ncbi:MAG: pyruvate:ferredoxin (flavodoxin) oxidoreductase [Lentisphaeria bacterium]|nr:pyruvate:ferredoxin (flavodoxin) oxidoreductase [Lentisphaeria bacterium]MDY0176168.1 pyruvate:ferredoxin (flavodoxin) oxidoreductase [Lentisphaeria bacterium]
MAKMVTIDGNTAASHVAYAFSEVAAIYPITPSSVMGELADSWAAQGRLNMFGRPLSIVEMQSEAGAAGALHGSLVAGALSTTYTASQGLLLMIPNMYKIAGEMLPTVFHVSARSLAAQSLAIFGDHADVMACRGTGFAMLASSSVQEAQDMAAIAHLATLEANVPFLHFFDGFRTSHEIQKMELLDYDELRAMCDMKYVEAFRERALRPEKPVLNVAAQNPDVYFQGRETSNLHYAALPKLVQKYMDKFAAATGRQYHLFDYVGAADAEKVIVVMGSGAETVALAVNHLNSQGAKLGMVNVRFFLPFDNAAFLAALPASTKKIAVLDRSKEPGAAGEPLYLSVVNAVKESAFGQAKIIGGRYGLASKEFTPAMVKAVFDHLDGKAFHDFTVGITDDVSHKSLSVGTEFECEPAGTISCTFWGLGSDGTVGANKDSIKLIGDETELYAQGYFSYDSKKSGGVTVSHLRFGQKPITSPYLISHPNFVACHNPAYIGRYDMISGLKEGGVFLLNSEFSNDEVFSKLTKEMQETIVGRKIRFYNIDALKIATEAGLGKRINSVMQTAFFLISEVIDKEQAIKMLKASIEKRFKRKGMDIVKMNWVCVDNTAAALEEIKVPASLEGVESFELPALLPADADDFAKKVILPAMLQKGDDIPVSAMSLDGKLPTGTAALEKRGIAPRIPVWVAENCIQCNICSMVCPHAAIRSKLIPVAELASAPADFGAVDVRPKADPALKFKVQVYCEDCQGCGVCVQSCPMSSKDNKALVWGTLEEARQNGEVAKVSFFENSSDNILGNNRPGSVKGSQFKKPLFEFSGACAGCGETPYVKLVTQLFGENMVVANATGCSSIYGGTFPTIPYCKSKEGRGPAWANSLFEDNAEFGLGMRLAINANREQLKLNVDKMLESAQTPAELKAALELCMSLWKDKGPEAVAAQEAVKPLLAKGVPHCAFAAKAYELADYFVDKSVWIIGGDGWAYDIGYGGLDHVMASGLDVNILVLDTEVYSNTGGQASKATQIGAVAQFAAGGKRLGKKNMGIMAMSYGYVYVASCSMGANRQQTLNALTEAEAYEGPSLVMAYSPCINHGIDMMYHQEEQKKAVECGYVPLYRYNPAGGDKRFSWDCKEPNDQFQAFLAAQGRYRSLRNTPAAAEADELFKLCEEDALRRNALHKNFGELI